MHDEEFEGEYEPAGHGIGVTSAREGHLYPIILNVTIVTNIAD